MHPHHIRPENHALNINRFTENRINGLTYSWTSNYLAKKKDHQLVSIFLSRLIRVCFSGSVKALYTRSWSFLEIFKKSGFKDSPLSVRETRDTRLSTGSVRFLTYPKLLSLSTSVVTVDLSRSIIFDMFFMVNSVFIKRATRISP